MNREGKTKSSAAKTLANCGTGRHQSTTAGSDGAVSPRGCGPSRCPRRPSRCVNSNDSQSPTRLVPLPLLHAHCAAPRQSSSPSPMPIMPNAALFPDSNPRGTEYDASPAKIVCRPHWPAALLIHDSQSPSNGQSLVRMGLPGPR